MPVARASALNSVSGALMLGSGVARPSRDRVPVGSCALEGRVLGSHPLPASVSSSARSQQQGSAAGAFFSLSGVKIQQPAVILSTKERAQPVSARWMGPALLGNGADP